VVENSFHKKSAARLYAVQALFQMEHSALTVDSVIIEFEEYRIGADYNGIKMVDCNLPMFKTILNKAVENQDKIDQVTDRALAKNWPIDRIDPTLRALFRASGAEFVSGVLPAKVIIVEYLGVAQAFFSQTKEIKFVNAVLDHMAREFLPKSF